MRQCAISEAGLTTVATTVVHLAGTVVITVHACIMMNSVGTQLTAAKRSTVVNNAAVLITEFLVVLFVLQKKAILAATKQLRRCVRNQTYAAAITVALTHTSVVLMTLSVVKKEQHVAQENQVPSAVQLVLNAVGTIAARNMRMTCANRV